MEILPVGHWLFQLAQLLLLLSYLTTSVLILRTLLACAALCFVLWAWLVLAIAVDTTIWNIIFCVINTIQALILLLQKRPIKFKHSPHERIYQEMFRDVGVSRHDFRQLAKMGYMRSSRAGSYYIEAGNIVNNLSLLYKGKLELYQRHRNRAQTVNMVYELEFVESPEWAARRNRRNSKAPRIRHSVVGTATEEILLEFPEAETIEVSVKAVENSYFLTWPVEQLEAYLAKNPHMEAPLNAAVGADVAKKIIPTAPTISTKLRIY